MKSDGTSLSKRKLSQKKRQSPGKLRKKSMKDEDVDLMDLSILEIRLPRIIKSKAALVRTSRNTPKRSAEVSPTVSKLQKTPIKQ